MAGTDQKDAITETKDGRAPQVMQPFNKHTKAAAAPAFCKPPKLVGWLGCWGGAGQMATVLSLLVMLRSQQQYGIVILHVWK